MFGSKKVRFKIDGMSCEHCEKRVVEAVKSLPDIRKASANHMTGELLISAPNEVDTERLKAAVAEAGYTVVD